MINLTGGVTAAGFFRRFAMTRTELTDHIRVAVYRTESRDFDTEISDNIDAGTADLGIAGITTVEITDALIVRALMTYCAMHRINIESDEYNRLKASYDEQKAQLTMATGYTTWSKT